MADPATNTSYPASIDVLPEIGPNDKQNDAGLEHDVVHDKVNAILNQLQTLVGLTSDDATDLTVLGRLLSKIGDAPSNGTAYVRKDGAWQPDAAAPLQTIIVACSDETTNVTAGTAKVTFRMPFAFTLSAVRASLTVAQAAGSIFTVDINENGTSVLSTKLTIDNTEKTSVTAAAPAVISDTSLASDSEITIDVDQVGTALAKGLKVALIGRPT